MTEQVKFATKPGSVWQMIATALEHIPDVWVACSGVYGRNAGLRAHLKQWRVGCVMEMAVYLVEGLDPGGVPARYTLELDPRGSLWSHMKKALGNRLFRRLEEPEQVTGVDLRLMCKRTDLLRGLIESDGWSFHSSCRTPGRRSVESCK